MQTLHAKWPESGERLIDSPIENFHLKPEATLRQTAFQAERLSNGTAANPGQSCRSIEINRRLSLYARLRISASYEGYECMKVVKVSKIHE